MNLHRFSEQIEEVERRNRILQNRFREIPQPQQNLISQALHELCLALEELHVAEEELQQQNDQLIAAYQQIEIERHRYQELFDFAPDAYVVTDTNGKILEVNRAATNLFQTSKKFLVGKPLTNYIVEAERRRFRTLILLLHDVECIKEWETHITTRQGNRICLCLSVTTVLNGQGKSPNWRWLLRDISERKQAEAQLQSVEIQNMRLQEAARIKSHFMGVISHELRTPMNSIMGFSQLLLRLHHQQFSPPSIALLEKILGNGKSLLQLIQNMLDITKLEAGRIELQPDELNVGELVTEVTKEMRFFAQQQNLTLAVCLNIENPVIVNDGDRLRQIIVNLISNAIKYTETGGVFVEVEAVNSDRIAIAVKDTGIGVPKTELKNIFLEFWQVNQSITRHHGGVGLGLAIVKHIVDLMDGTINVKSKIGEGSSFRIELPRVVGR